jgi:serine/threonine-protein kinase
MAPEQARGSRTIDARADLYSLAVIAYRTLTGQLAFSRGDLGQVMIAVMREMPEDPKRHRDNLPDDVALALRIGLAKNPEDRYATGEALAKAFESAFAGTLDPALRARAQRLLSEQPWGMGTPLDEMTQRRS